MRLTPTATPSPGDVVVADVPGAVELKRRPAVVVSSNLYHSHRPDVIVGVLTTNLAASSTPLDYGLLDWSAAGLRRASAFRCYLATLHPRDVSCIGRLSARDWREVQMRVASAFGIELTEETEPDEHPPA